MTVSRSIYRPTVLQHVALVVIRALSHFATFSNVCARANETIDISREHSSCSAASVDTRRAERSSRDTDS
jgi:hypothetical protein